MNINEKFKSKIVYSLKIEPESMTCQWKRGEKGNSFFFSWLYHTKILIVNIQIVTSFGQLLFYEKVAQNANVFEQDDETKK